MGVGELAYNHGGWMGRARARQQGLGCCVLSVVSTLSGICLWLGVVGVIMSSPDTLTGC